MSIAATFPAAGPRTVRRAAAPRAVSRTARRSSGPAWRLTRRGRIVVGVLASLPCAALLVINGSVAADAGTGAELSPATAVVVVQPGESLWQIARAVAPQDDPRATVALIREVNGLGTDAVVPGQSLVVPAASS